MLPKDSERRSEIPTLHEKGYMALEVMEQYLIENMWLVGTHVTVADIALYAYTHKAPLGGFDMSRFPAINKWCKQIEDTPNYMKMF